MATIKWETADNMMNIVAFVAMKTGIEQGEQIDLEAIKKFARDMFQEYCDTVGITEVEATEEENTEDLNEECSGSDEEDNQTYSLTAKGEFVLRYVEAGYAFEEVCEIADLLFGDGE